MKRIVTVNDRMQNGYRYELVVPQGRYFHPDFRPQLSPLKCWRSGYFAAST